MALAVNRSFSKLTSRNLSISNYTIGQHDITTVIEEQIKSLSFQGAGGWVEFNQYRSGSTPVEILWILKNGKASPVGKYDLLNVSNFYVNLNANDIPNDTVPRVYKNILIPFSATIVLYILTGGVIIFTTIQLVIYFRHRKHKAIKATSPFLSLLMFTGCYILCAAAVQLNTLGSFSFSTEIFFFLLISYFIITINGISLVFLTLLADLLRVHYIFSCWNKAFTRCWNNIPLLFKIIVPSIVLNIGLAVLIALKPPKHSSYQCKFFLGNIDIQTEIKPITSCLLNVLVIVFLFPTLLIYMGVHLRNLKTKIFCSNVYLIYWFLFYFFM